MKTRRHGFSLIEAAIVLGIIGLVIGGIWIAASAAFRAHKLNSTAQGLAFMASNFQNNFSQADADAYGTNFIEWIGNYAKWSPADWAKGSDMYSPMGHRVRIYNESWFHGFAVMIYTVNKQDCVDIVNKVGAYTRNGALGTPWRITPFYSSTYYDFNTFPVPPTEAVTGCGTSNDTLNLYYNYTH